MVSGETTRSLTGVVRAERGTWTDAPFRDTLVALRTTVHDELFSFWIHFGRESRRTDKIILALVNRFRTVFYPKRRTVTEYIYIFVPFSLRVHLSNTRLYKSRVLRVVLRRPAGEYRAHNKRYTEITANCRRDCVLKADVVGRLCDKRYIYI